MGWVLHSTIHVGLRLRMWWGGAEVKSRGSKYRRQCNQSKSIEEEKRMRPGELERKKETRGTTGDNNQVQPTTAPSHRDDQSDLGASGTAG